MALEPEKEPAKGTIEPSLVSAVAEGTNQPVVNEIWQGKVSNLFKESTMSNGVESLPKFEGNDMYVGLTSRSSESILKRAASAATVEPGS